jgi:hypothetical protein
MKFCRDGVDLEGLQCGFGGGGVNLEREQIWEERDESFNSLTCNGVVVVGIWNGSEEMGNETFCYNSREVR